MQAAARHIKENMQAIESGCSHTEKTRIALEISKTSLEQIHTSGEDIEKLVWGVEFAHSYLASKNETAKRETLSKCSLLYTIQRM